MRTVTAALVVFLGVTAGSAGAEIIDRILAVVGNTIVTQSDVLAAMRLRLEAPPANAADPVGATLERLIERRLMLSEVDRYVPPAPAEADVSLRVEQVRLSFPSAEAWQKALAETGFDEEQLRRYVRDDLRIIAYLQQRFGTAQPPSEEEVLEYYREHPEQFTVAGVLRPFGEAHDVARAALIAARRSTVVRDWVAGLRRRASVSVLYGGR